MWDIKIMHVGADFIVTNGDWMEGFTTMREAQHFAQHGTRL